MGIQLFDSHEKDCPDGSILRSMISFHSGLHMQGTDFSECGDFDAAWSRHSQQLTTDDTWLYRKAIGCMGFSVGEHGVLLFCQGFFP